MISGGCVYILTNKHHTVFYAGVTSSLVKRIQEHKTKLYPKSFTARYNCDKLVYYYFYDRIEDAISAEKQLKKANRQRKIDLINGLNPEWKDLYESLF